METVLESQGQTVVSVVIPAYNEEKWIGSCLQSVLRDSYPQKEIIVVDDASTDTTGEILKRFPVKVIRNEKRVGPSSARNIGVREAKGEIIVFIDAHCIIDDPNWIKKFLHFFEDPKVGAVGGYFKREQTKYGMASRFESNNPPSPRRLVKSANGAYRRIVFEQVGGFDPGVEWGGDAALTYKIWRSEWKIVHSRNIVVTHGEKIWSIKRVFSYGTCHFPLHKKYPKETELKLGKGLSLGPMFIGTVLTLALIVDVIFRLPIFTPSVIVFFSLMKGVGYEGSIPHRLINGLYTTLWDFVYYLGALYGLLRGK